MLGRIGIISGKGKTLRVEREQLQGLPMLRIWLPENYTQRQLRRCGKKLSKWGVSRVLTPQNFTQWEILEPYGLRGVLPGEFCRWLAPKLTMEALDVPPQQATVVLVGQRVNRSIRQAALQLCPLVRRLVIEVPNGGEELRQELLQEYGLPALEGIGGAEADLQVFFSPTPGKTGRSLDLSGGYPELEGWMIWTEHLLPEGVDRLPFLAALWECGRLENTKIFVKTPSRP